MFLRLFLFSLQLANLCRCCSNSCFFLWDKSKSTSNGRSYVNTGIVSSNDEISRPVVTIDGSTRIRSSDHDESTNIAFSDESDHVPFNLKLETDNSSDVHLNPGVNPDTITMKYPSETPDIRIQITESQKNGNYKLFTGKSGNYLEWRPDNQAISLSNIVRIAATVSTYHSLNFISICEKTAPIICPSPLSLPTLGQDYNITCTGSGAPYLTLEWQYDTSLSVIEHPPTRDMSRADHVITSVLTVPNYSLHRSSASSFRCVVTNGNLGDVAETVFRLPYPAEHAQATSSTPLIMASQTDNSVVFLSDIMFIGGSNTSLQWNITGIPIDNLHVQCNTSDPITALSSTSPNVFTATLTSNDDVITCTLYNHSAPLTSTTLHRVGWNCPAGERGVGLRCVTCDTGYTSKPGSDTCYHGNSTCFQGQYGDGVCAWCPWGMTSSSHSVKIQECYTVHPVCPENHYSNNTACSVCPFGYVSQPGAAKVQDCVRAYSKCPANFYKSGSDCLSCPEGMVSNEGAVKEEDCENRSSGCTAGYYGVESCQLCPWGQTGVGGSGGGYVRGVVKAEDCFTPPTNCSANHYTAVNCTGCQGGECGAGCLVTTCVPCPANHTSVSGAAKSHDCRVQCSAGWYQAPTRNRASDGYMVREESGNPSNAIITTPDGNASNSRVDSGYNTSTDACLRCPDGDTSPVGSTRQSDCHSAGVSVQVQFVIGVLVVMVLLGLVMVGTIVRYHVRTKYKKRRIRDFFEKQRNVHGTYVLQSNLPGMQADKEESRDAVDL